MNIDLMVRLLREVTESHRDRESADYNECETSPCHFCELVETALAEGAPAPAPAWQPMETAPKDGKSIIGYRQGWFINGGEVNITCWRAEWNSWGLPGVDWEPTHWQPLQPPPENKEQ